MKDYVILQGKPFPKNIGYVGEPRWKDNKLSAYFDLNTDTQFKVVTKPIDEIRKDYYESRKQKVKIKINKM